MKTLLLVRHAKSDHGDPRLADHDRELNERGLRDAPMMGRRLVARGVAPDLIVSSTARRALHTARLLAEAIDYPRRRIETRAELYAASEDTWLETIELLPDDRACAMIVGHNPEITAVANRLGRRPIDNVPTCGILLLEYATDAWVDVPSGTPCNWVFDYPKAAH